VHALQGLVGRYYYAASIAYDDVRVGPMNDISNIDAVALHLLSTEATDCVLAGSQYSRVAKTERVSQIELSYRLISASNRRLRR